MVRWPAAGSALVDLPAAATAATASARAGAAGARVKAGALPVTVAAAAAPPGTARASAEAEAPARVKVDLVGRHADGLLLRVNRADGVAKAARVSVEVDYSGFRDAYGGDWATRLRLVALPECATATPERAECRGTPVATRNNGSGRLSGDVPVGVPGTGLAASEAAGSGVFAVIAAAAGTSGDFGQSSLAPSATWQAGGPSGDFTWNYPISVPPALGGPVPDLTVGLLLRQRRRPHHGHQQPAVLGRRGLRARPRRLHRAPLQALFLGHEERALTTPRRPATCAGARTT